MKYGAVQEIYTQSGMPESESCLFDRVNDICDNILLFKDVVLGNIARTWYVVWNIIKLLIRIYIQFDYLKNVKI